MSSLDFTDEIESTSDLTELIQNNPGVLVLKMGATWCGPCKRIKDISQKNMVELKETYKERVNIIEIDIDDSFELYANLKTKRIVNGIPAILCWFKDNNELRPSDFINDSDPTGVALLFERCKNFLDTHLNL